MCVVKCTCVGRERKGIYVERGGILCDMDEQSSPGKRFFLFSWMIKRNKSTVVLFTCYLSNERVRLCLSDKKGFS